LGHINIAIYNELYTEKSYTMDIVMQYKKRYICKLSKYNYAIFDE